MNLFSGRASALAVLVATALLAASAAPAQAVTRADQRYDLQWRRENGAGSPTAAEGARTDITGVSYFLGERSLVVKFGLRDWTPPCTSTVPCVDQTFRAELENGSGSRSVMVSWTTYGSNPNRMSYMTWWNETAGTQGIRCQDGQITGAPSATADTATIRIPRGCFPTGWRFRSVEGYSIQTWRSSTSEAWRDAWDFTSPVGVDWTPHR